MPPKIFVAGTRDDLGSCHIIVRNALVSLGWEPVEEVAAQGPETGARLREKIADCEAVVYLVGECFGPQGPARHGISNSPRSFAQFEFEIAWELNKPICILVFPDDFPFDNHEPEPPDRRVLQENHRVALCSDDKPCVNVKDKSELADVLEVLLPLSESVSARGASIISEGRQFLPPIERIRACPEPRLREEEPSPQTSPAQTPVSFHDNVQFTAYRPKVIAPAKWTKMLVFAHLDDRPDWLDDDELGPIEEMELEATRILGSKKIEDFRQSTSDSSVAIPEDGEITIVPEIKGIEFNPPRRSFLWKDGVTVHHETFDMRASAALDGHTARGLLTIFLGHLILAEITLAIRVGNNQDAAKDSSSVGRQRNSAHPFRRVFTSYSRRDLPIVEATERYGRTLGDEYIRDLIYLRSGELWNDQLRELVRWADVFQLFWSANAARSEFVESEWRYALTLNRPAFVRPTYWQEPMPEPPEPLRGIHFHRLIAVTPTLSSEQSVLSDAALAQEVECAPRAFMPDSGSKGDTKFMPSGPATVSNSPPIPFLTPRTAKLILLCLVIAAILLIVVALLKRP